MASGNVSLRLPQSLHAALLEEAEQEGVSLNQLCVSKLSVQLRELAGRAREYQPRTSDEAASSSVSET